jgi:5-methylcytosine-specific restriction endonuclease McrA
MENQDSYNGKDMDWIYKYILEEQNHKCAICGLPDIYNDKPYTMILNHIDKDKSNNHRDNLRLICPNCYSFIRKRKNN